MRFGSGLRSVRAILMAACWFSGCTHRHDGLAKLEAKKTEAEAILAKDPANYHALHDLAIIYGSFYMRDTMTGGASIAADKEKALAYTHDALKKAPLTDTADLGLNLERLGYEQEALSVYEKFLKEAQQTSAPIANLASNAPAVMAREAEAEWRGLITIVQTRADLLRKKLAEQQQSP